MSPSSVSKAMQRVEQAATEVLYWADHHSTTSASFHDAKVRRRALLGAAREYGTAIRALARLRA